MPTRPARTPRLPPEERRRQLLDAALQVLAEEGFDALTVEAIARRAGLTRPVIYDQFGDLDGLLLALVDREEQAALAPLLGIVGELPSDDVAPDAFLVDAVRQFLTAVSAAPTTWRLVLMPRDGGPPELRERVQRSRRMVTERVSALVGWGVERRGGPEGLDVELLGRLLVAAGEDAARLVIAQPETFTPERLAHAAAAVVRLVPPDTVLPAVEETEPASAEAAVEPADARGGAAETAEADPEGAKARRVPMSERRQQLLDHALALAADEGFDALTVEAIARRAGVSRVIVYRAYASLNVLLLALLERENRRMREQLERLLPHDPAGRSARQVMEEALTGFLAMVMADPQTWRVALQRPESAPKALQLVVSRRRADLARRLRPLVAWGIQRLDAPPDELDPDLVSRLLLTAGEELGRIALTEPELPPARLVASVTRVVGALPWR